MQSRAHPCLSCDTQKNTEIPESVTWPARVGLSCRYPLCGPSSLLSNGRWRYFREIKWPECEVNRSPPSTAEGYNACASVSTPLTRFLGMILMGGGGIFGFKSSRRGLGTSLHHRVEKGSGVHTASYPEGTRGSSLGVKRLGREADHSPPLVPRPKNEWSCTSIPPTRLRGVVLS
jgi:hypothetical protein